jgi:anti-sigma factor RsiW
MNRPHDAVDECEHGADIGAYLLSALPPEDHERFAAHLSTCRACREEVAQLQIVVDTLPMAAPQLVPPPALKDRIMRVVDSEAELLRASGPEADRAPAPRERRARRWGRLALRPASAGILAGVLVAVGVATGVLLSSGSDDGPATRTVVAQVAAPRAKAMVSVRGGRATLHLTNLPSAPAGRVYQVWFTRKGSIVPIATHTLFNVRKDDGRAVVPIEEDVTGVEQVLVTDEPDGGSRTPTGTKLIAATLS